LAAEWRGRVHTKEKQDGRCKATPYRHDYIAVRNSQVAKL